MNPNTHIETRKWWRAGRVLALAAAVLTTIACLLPAQAGAVQLGQNGRIAFSAGGDIHTINGNGTGLAQLVFPGGDRDPSFSPDGTKIAFEHDNHIFVVDAALSTQPVQITFGNVKDSDPSFEPLGNRISFVRRQLVGGQFGNGDIWLVNAAGGGEQNLTNSVQDERDPTWSQGGDKLAFTRSATLGGTGDIYTMSETGAGVVPVAAGAADEHEPSWFFGKIAYTRAASAGSIGDIWVMKADGTGKKQLTSSAGDDREPAGSPDGKQIVFVSDRTGVDLLYRMDANGVTETALAGAPNDAREPDYESVFSLNLNPSPGQSASNVAVETHGTFVVVSFDQAIAAAGPRVELWKGNVVRLQIAGGPAQKHYDVKVTHLDPGTAYTLKIVMGDGKGGTKTYAHPKQVQTLERNVSITSRWIKMHNDSDPGSCGDFQFWFEAEAAGIAPIGAGYYDETSVCDGESWDMPDKTVTLKDVPDDDVSVYALGVDDDWDCLVPACLDSGISKGEGEWSEKSLSIDVGPMDFTAAGEAWAEYRSVYVNAGDGDLSFTWYYRVSVTYG